MGDVNPEFGPDDVFKFAVRDMFTPVLIECRDMRKKTVKSRAQHGVRDGGKLRRREKCRAPTVITAKTFPRQKNACAKIT